ncbi:MAG: hypothetical protein ACTSYC_06250 [Promethearchaeota archaeon]
MSFLLIPIAPLSRTKSRLREYFSKEILKELTLAMFDDLTTTLYDVNCFKEKIIYCNSSEILELAESRGFIAIKEEINSSSKVFDDIINQLNDIALNEFKAKSTVITFLDVILISSKNFYEIYSLLSKNQLVICPAINSAGISILGRNPPDVVPSCFSDPLKPSFIAQINKAREMGVSKIAIYDSFRAGFDIDIKQDLVLACEYLKLFNLTHTKTYKFLEKFNFSLQKANSTDNRKFSIIERNDLFKKKI